MTLLTEWRLSGRMPRPIRTLFLANARTRETDTGTPGALRVKAGLVGMQQETDIYSGKHG